MTDDRPLTLDQACRELLQNLVRPSTLRAAIEEGTLHAERLGRRLVVTPADVSQWRKHCRDKQRARVSICTNTPDVRLPGSFEMDPSVSPQDVLLRHAEMLRKRSRSTSQESTSPSPKVVRLR